MPRWLVIALIVLGVLAWSVLVALFVGRAARISEDRGRSVDLCQHCGLDRTRPPGCQRDPITGRPAHFAAGDVGTARIYRIGGRQ